MSCDVCPKKFKYMFVKTNMMNKYFGIVLLVVSALLFGFSVSQTGWAASIYCNNISPCDGTTSDDIIVDFLVNGGGVVQGLEGNDIIIGNPIYPSYLYGGPGNDTLIGGPKNDGLYGELGNDRIEGGLGDDTIWEGGTYTSPLTIPGRFEGNDDISGGPGNDIIAAGGGSDRIFGGPGNDTLGSSSYNRDFVKDEVDCGSGMDTVTQFYSGDGDTAVYCETINNLDG
jgi:Ca2+-binding RTX toxin-like protein